MYVCICMYICMYVYGAILGEKKVRASVATTSALVSVGALMLSQLVPLNLRLRTLRFLEPSSTLMYVYVYVYEHV